MVSLKGKYLVSFPNIFWAGLNTFFEHLQCGAKLAPEGLVEVLLGHSGKKVSSIKYQEFCTKYEVQSTMLEIRSTKDGTECQNIEC